MISSSDYHFKRIHLVILAVILIVSIGISVFSLLPNRKSSQDIRSKASGNDNEDASAEALGRVKENFSLPSILGFQTDSLTGTAAVSYDFNMPDGPGGLKPAMGLMYSSSLVSDWGKGFGLGSKANYQYIAQAGQVGFGWQMTGVGSITKIRDKENIYVLNLGGASYKLIKTSSGWATSPVSFFRIEHENYRCEFNREKTAGVDQWKIINSKGTTFIFGDDITRNGTSCRITSDASVRATAMRHIQDADSGEIIYEPYKWMLREVKDLHQNTINYHYTQEVVKTYCLSDSNVLSGDMTYTSSVNLESVSYGSNGEFDIKIDYEKRPDYKKPETNPPPQRNQNRPGCNQEYSSQLRINKITVLVYGRVRNEYHLKHENDGPQFSQERFAHTLLKKISKKGVGGKGSTSSYAFTYSAYANAPNLVLLKTADNGQGGIVMYSYVNQPGTRCRINGLCFKDSSAHHISVSSKEVSDTVTGNKYTVSYEYQNGLGIFETQNRDDSKIYDGYQFLGFRHVLEKTGKINHSEAARIIKTAFYIHQEEDKENPNCFNPHKFYGKIKKIETLDNDGTMQSGKILSTVNNSYLSIPDHQTGCINDYKAYPQRILPLVLPAKVQTITDGTTKETMYRYDQFANVVQISDLGYTDDPSDDVFSFTKYTYNTAGNILNKPYLHAVAFDSSGKNLVSFTETYYDHHNNLSDPPEKGDITKVVRGGKNTLAEVPHEETSVLASVNEENPNVLGFTTDLIKVYIKEKSVNGPNFRETGRRVELRKIIKSKVCGDVCDSSCSDKVCQKISSPYNKNKGYASFPVGFSGTTYVFSVKGLGRQWSQKICEVSDYPVNTSCTIVVKPAENSNITVTPTPGSSISFTPPPTLPVPSVSLPPPYQLAASAINYEYDQWGNQIKITNDLNQITQTTYDPTHTQPVQITNTAPYSWSKTFEYDPILLKPVKEITENGAVVEITYDSFGRIVEMYGAAEPISEKIPTVRVKYTENPFSVRVEALKDKAGKKYSSAFTVYNGLGQELQTQRQWSDQTIHVFTKAYNSLGLADYVFNPVFADSDKFGNLIRNDFSPEKGTQYAYDMLGRLFQTKYADGTEEKNQYFGKTTTAVDRNGSQNNKRVAAYNGQGRVVILEEHADGKIFRQQFFYDPLGKILSYLDPAGHISTNKYDTLGRLVSETNSDSGTTNYTYDSLGNKLTKTDNKGQEIRYSYDQLNRLITKTYPDHSTAVYAYDEGSKENRKKLTSVTYADTVSRYSYNINNLLIREERQIAGNPARFITEFTYDPLRFIKTVRYPEDNEEVTYAHDHAKNLISVSGTLGKIVDSISYTPVRQIAEVKYANNTNLQKEYYPGNMRLKNWKYLSNSHSLADKTYDYDKTGNIVKITDNKDSAKSVEYAYDQLYRLVGATGAIKSNYTYDTDSNLIEKKEDAVTVSSVYKSSESAAVHAPKSVNGKALSYDPNGNLTDDQNSNLKITYDFEQRPVEIDNLSSDTRTKLFYDGEGRRVKKELYRNLSSPVISSTAYYVNPYYQIEINSNNQKKVTKFYKNFAYRENGNIFYLAADHLSSARLSTDSEGSKISSLDYYPYGLPIQTDSNNRPPNTWIGEKYDDETGLYFLNARYYSPLTGKFIQPDKINDPLSRGNRYVYSGNSPLVYSDPSGNCAVVCSVILTLIDQLVNPSTAYAGDHNQVTPEEKALDEARLKVTLEGGDVDEFDRKYAGGQDPVKETLLDTADQVVLDLINTAVEKVVEKPLAPVSIAIHIFNNATGLNIPANPGEVVSAVTENVANEENDNAPDPNTNGPSAEPAPTPPPAGPETTPVPTPPPPEPTDPPPPQEGGGCFLGDTPILTENGYKNIERFRIGDKILTRRSENSPNLVEGIVSHVYQFSVRKHLIINGKIKVTGEHRFFINGQWAPAGGLRIGDSLLDKNNRSVKVVSLEEKEGSFVVYNLTVKKYASFFAEDIYVHNMQAEGK